MVDESLLLYAYGLGTKTYNLLGTFLFRSTFARSQGSIDKAVMETIVQEYNSTRALYQGGLVISYSFQFEDSRHMSLNLNINMILKMEPC